MKTLLLDILKKSIINLDLFLSINFKIIAKLIIIIFQNLQNLLILLRSFSKMKFLLILTLHALLISLVKNACETNQWEDSTGACKPCHLTWYCQNFIINFWKALLVLIKLTIIAQHAQAIKHSIMDSVNAVMKINILMNKEPAKIAFLLGWIWFFLFFI